MSAAQVRSRATRRAFVLGGGAALVVSGLVATKWYNVFADTSAADTLAPAEALELAQKRAAYLIDIRRPDEWQKTGIAAPALAMDLRQPDFFEKLKALRESDPNKPIILICARGVRSANMRQRLQEMQVDKVFDVPEGMLGSGAGAGWIARGLPLRSFPE